MATTSSMHAAVPYTPRCTLAKAYAQEWATNPSSFGLAIGATEPWENDMFPPVPSPSLLRVPSLFSVSYIQSCDIVYSNPEGSLITAVGNFSSLPISSSVATLASAKANSVLLQATLSLAALPPEFRVLAVLRDLALDGGATLLSLSNRYVPNIAVVDYSLDYIATSSPLASAELATYTMQILRTF